MISKTHRFDPSGALGSGCFVNVITGARSFGKTYAFKKIAIKNYLKNGNTWVYLRTFDANLKHMLNESSEPFFSDIIRNEEFPGYLFRTRGMIMELAKQPADGKNPKWEPFGSFMSLTSFDAQKGKAVARCNMIVYDEFISEKEYTRYPPNAVEKLLSIWESLDRREDRIRIFMLANAADMVNPFFRTWHIVPIPRGTSRTFKVGRSRLYYENAYDAAFTEEAKQTAIGSFTAGTAYERYASENFFKNASGAYCEKRDKRNTPRMSIKWHADTFTLWYRARGGWYIDRSDPNCSFKFCLYTKDQTPDYPAIDDVRRFLVIIRRYFRRNTLWFDSDETRELWFAMSAECGVK